MELNFRHNLNKLIRFCEYAGLIVIALSTVVAVGIEIFSMFARLEVQLADLLLLFIYLEVLVMVSNYLESGKMPIRVPIYIAIVALARYVIIDMKNMENYRLLVVTGGALLLSLTVLSIRYGHVKFPYLSTKALLEKKEAFRENKTQTNE